MELFSTTVSSILRNVVDACRMPVIVLLLIFMVAVVVLLGTLIAEAVSERRHFKVFLPELVEQLKVAETSDDVKRIVRESGLLLKQKQILTELASHPDITPEMRESMAVSLEFGEQRKYDARVKISDIMARLAPMLGLLGTLIPLGPGILALGSGDVETLSASLITAFDTTSLGLMIAGVALIISAIRKRWYKGYMTVFDSVIEMVLDVEAQRGTKGHADAHRGAHNK